MSILLHFAPELPLLLQKNVAMVVVVVVAMMGLFIKRKLRMVVMVVVRLVGLLVKSSSGRDGNVGYGGIITKKTLLWS